MQEKINFQFKTNLDQIAKSVKKLSDNVDILSKSFYKKNILLDKQNKLEEKNSKTINKLGSEYGDLNEKFDVFIKKGKDLTQTYKTSSDDIKKISGSVDDFQKTLLNSVNKQYDDELERRKKKIREIEESVANFVLKTLDKIHSIGATLTAEAAHLKPFAMDFMNSFSFNPLKFFGAGQAMKESFELIKYFQQMRHDLAGLSDASGNAAGAVSLVYRIASKSAIASGTSMGVVKTLLDQGITSQKSMEKIGILSGDLQAATGIAASTWAGFTGELAFNYGIPAAGLQNIASALVGTDLRGAQLEKTMGTVNKILQTTGFIAGKPTNESVLRLTKTVGASIKTFQAMGISAEKAGGFIEGIVDPENFEKNSFLFAKLGINASQYAEYLDDVDGQQKLLQKTMENLPELASEITNIRNPYARLNFAKTLGLDMQIVRNMAGKSKGEIQKIVAEYQAKNKANEALEAKRKQMAAESAKFDDMMMGLKLKVLAPIMNFLTKGKGLNNFISILPTIAITIGRIFEAMVPIIKVMTDAFNELVPILADFVERFVAPFISAFPNMLKYIMKELLPFFDYTAMAKSEGESPTKQLYVGITSILGYLSKIYLLILGWKALSFFGNLYDKTKEIISPKSKTLSNVTLQEYLTGMKQIQPGASRGLRGSPTFFGGLGMGGKIGFLAIAGFLSTFIATWAVRKILPNFLIPEQKPEDLKTQVDKGKILDRFSQRLGFLFLPKSMGGPGINQVAKVFTSKGNIFGGKTPTGKIFKDGVSAIKKAFQSKEAFKEFAKQGFKGLFSTKLLETGGRKLDLSTRIMERATAPFVKGGNLLVKSGRFASSGLLGKVGGFMTGYNVLTATSYEELFGIVGSLGGARVAASILPAILGKISIGGFKGGIAKLATVAAAYGVLSLSGDYLGSYIGKIKDANRYVLETSDLLSKNLGIGIQSIFKAFKSEDFDTVGAQVRIIMDMVGNEILNSLREISLFGSLFGKKSASPLTVQLMANRIQKNSEKVQDFYKKYEGKILAPGEKEQQGKITIDEFLKLADEERKKITAEGLKFKSDMSQPYGVMERAGLDEKFKQEDLNKILNENNYKSPNELFVDSAKSYEQLGESVKNNVDSTRLLSFNAAVGRLVEMAKMKGKEDKNYQDKSLGINTKLLEENRKLSEKLSEVISKDIENKNEFFPTSGIQKLSF